MIARSEGGSLRWAKLGRGLAYGTCALVAMLTFQLGACGDSSMPAGGGGSGGNPSGDAFADSECGICIETECAEALDGCISDPGCSSYLDCLLACPLDDFGNADPSCDAACVGSESSETTAARIHLTGCREHGPGAECPTCGFAQPPIPVPLSQVCEDRVAPNPCRQCFWDHCCDTWDACFDGNNDDCDALATCIEPCKQEDDSEACVADCFAQHSASVGTYLDQNLCASAMCAIEQMNCDADARDDCDVCLYETCGTPLHDLIATEPGFLLWVCNLDCAAAQADPDCYKACTDNYPDLKDEYLLWGECLQYECSAICEG